MKEVSRSYIGYKSYTFYDHNPVIDIARTAIQDSGMTFYQVEVASGVKAQTLSSWFNGKTRSPRHDSIEAVLRACGKRLVPADITPEAVKAEVELVINEGKKLGFKVDENGRFYYKYGGKKAKNVTKFVARRKRKE